MRKSIKKIVASVVAGAMALAMMVTPSVDAFAQNDDTTWYVVGNANYGYTGEEFEVWQPTKAAAMTANNDGTYSTSFEVTASQMCEFQILPTNAVWDGQIGAAAGGNFGYLALNAGTATITFDPSKEGDARVSVTGLVSPNPAEKYYVVGIDTWDPAAAPEMTANGDGTYSYTFDELEGNKYEFKIVQDGPNYGWYKQWADGENNFANADGLAWDYEKLVITFDPATGTVTSTATEVVKETEATTEETTTVPDDATTVTVHFQTEWVKPSIWAFLTDDDTVNLTGGVWPGVKLTANADNAGYYSTKLVLDEAKNVTVIVSGTDAATTATVQSVDIPLTVVEGTNEYWITLGEVSTEADWAGNYNYTATASTTAPEGWVASEVEELTTEATTTAAEGEEGENEEETTTAPDASAWEDALLKIHFLNSMEWEKVGVYLTYASWAQLTGAWPGQEMQLEDGSETWYAVCTNADAEEAYNVIFNNMVSDEEANAGEAQKEQTPDTKDLAPGEYWFVLGDVTAETDTQITYAVEIFDSVEALEEAGYEYDGNGLVGDVAVEAPEEETDAADDEEETTAEKADGATTGDAAPIAVVLLGMVAAVAVVASKKRQNA